MSETKPHHERLTLHGMQSSGNCYKIRLVAALLDVPLNRVEYNTLEGETRTETFLATVNANGRIPVLQIGSDTFLPESGAACYYLASSPQNTATLIPTQRLEHAQMLQWMFFEQYTHEPALAVLRFWRILLGEKNLVEAQRMQIPTKEKQAREALDVMEKHLTGREWFVGSAISLADICLYAYTHEADTFGFPLAEWPNVQAWCTRISRLDRYIGIED